MDIYKHKEGESQIEIHKQQDSAFIASLHAHIVHTSYIV